MITTGAEEARHCCFNSDGRWTDASANDHFQRTLKLTNVPDGVVVTVQDKAWMDHELMNVYLNKVWHPFIKRRA